MSVPTAVRVGRTRTSERPDSGRSTTGGVVRALARVEAVRMARHPLVLASLALSVALGWSLGTPLAFVLPRESALFSVALLPLAGASLLVAHAATTRIQRDDVLPIAVASPARRQQRVLAMLLATAGPSLLALATMVLALSAAAAAGGLGAPDLAEALTGPALVALGALAGVLVGCVAPHRAAAAAALVLLIALQALLTEIGGTPGVLGLMAPLVFESRTPYDPSGTVRRAGWHLLELGGLGVLLVAAAMLSVGGGRRWRSGLLAGLVLLAAAGLGQLRPPSEATIELLRARTSGEAAECGGAESVEVCALGLYSPWAREWIPPLAGVAERLDRAGLPRPRLRVQQRTDASAVAQSLSRWDATPREDLIPDAHLSDEITVSAYWPRGDAGSRAQLELALEYARRAVGIPAEVELDEPPVPPPADVEDGARFSVLAPCTPVGQARELVALWLAGQATETTATALRELIADAPYGLRVDVGADGASVAYDSPFLERVHSQALPGSQPRWSEIAGHYAVALMDRPTEQVMGALAVDWERWTDPSTPLRDLVDEVGLTVLPTGLDVPGADRIPPNSLGDDPENSPVVAFYRDVPPPPPESGVLPALLAIACP